MLSRLQPGSTQMGALRGKTQAPAGWKATGSGGGILPSLLLSLDEETGVNKESLQGGADLAPCLEDGQTTSLRLGSKVGFLVEVPRLYSLAPKCTCIWGWASLACQLISPVGLEHKDR